jgi:hypothetical protein
MVALAIVIASAVLCGLGAAIAAARLTRSLAAHRRGRLARRAATLLGALAGAEIATQLFELVRQLEANAESGNTLGPGNDLRSSLDAFSVAIAFRGIFFYGMLLVGLATLVGVAAMRRYATLARTASTD